MRKRAVWWVVSVLAAMAGCGGGDEAKEPWDLVFFSDSAGWGVAERYGALAAEELGREVRVHDYAQGGLSVASVLAQVKGEAAADIAAAEIVVVYGNPFGSGAPAVESPDKAQACHESAGELTGVVAPTTEADWQPYVDMLGQVYDEVWRLRKGQPTVLRALDLYEPRITELTAAGIGPECIVEAEAYAAAIQRAASAHGAMVISLLDLLNGPAHDQDPVAAGYIAEDGIHTTEAARELIAAAFHAAGYEPSLQPSA